MKYNLYVEAKVIADNFLSEHLTYQIGYVNQTFYYIFSTQELGIRQIKNKSLPSNIKFLILKYYCLLLKEGKNEAAEILSDDFSTADTTDFIKSALWIISREKVIADFKIDAENKLSKAVIQ